MFISRQQTALGGRFLNSIGDTNPYIKAAPKPCGHQTQGVIEQNEVPARDELGAEPWLLVPPSLEDLTALLIEFLEFLERTLSR